MSTLKVFTVALAYRVGSALLTRTSFVPDEYYQSVEPAYNLVYNASVIDNDTDNTWEWHSNYQMRSYVSIMHYIAWFYMGRSFFHTGYHGYVTKGPRVLQAVFAAVADTCFYLTCKHIYGASRGGGGEEGQKPDYSDPAYTAFLAHLFSWSCSYCLTRTIGNSNETFFCMIGSYFWIRCAPVESTDDIVHPRVQSILKTTAFFDSLLFKVIVSLSIYSRPSAALWWAPLVFADLLLRLRREGALAAAASGAAYSCCALAVWSICVAVDSALYTASNPLRENKDSLCALHSSLCGGRSRGPTIPPVNFYVFNIQYDFAALHFGAAEPMWMATQGLPTMLGLYAPLLLVGATSAGQAPIPTRLLALLLCSAIYLAGLACSSKHQELRFLLPALPPLHALVAHWATAAPLPSSRRRYRRLLRLAWLVHVLAAAFLALYHQCGSEQSLHALARDLSDLEVLGPSRARVLLATPCYALPHRSFLHSSRSASSFDVFAERCSPAEGRGGGAREFSIEDYLTKHLPLDRLADQCSSAYSTTFLVTFDAYSGQVQRHLEQSGLAQGSAPVRRYRHAYFDYDKDDPLDKQFVLLYKVDGARK